MEAKYTPGPWHIHWPTDDGFPAFNNNDWPAEFLVEFGNDGEDYGGFMAAGFRGYPRERDGKVQAYEPKQVARLIAAAPDLLEACKELEASAAYWSEYDVPLGIVDRLRAAITKATQ